MARRAGKAATRRARQRNVQRPPATPAASSPTAAEAVEPGTSAVTPKSSGTTSGPTATRRPVPVRQAVGSQLTASERSEYHYVERDLRDIGILTAAMAALLLLAWFALTATGIVA